MLTRTSPATADRAVEAPGTSLLRGRDGDTALVVDGRDVSYGELRERVGRRREDLGGTRRLVMLHASATLESVLTHLAALESGHPLLLVEGGAPGTPAGRHRQGLLDRFDPDVVAHGGPGGGLEVRRRGTRHTLHPDLALLLSTSGSTGSPKLVRLSGDSVRSNAEAVALSLGLTDTDVAATTMPLHYCYGLSVLHSHLVAGAGLLLTERSVVEEEFFAEFEAAGGTSFAGVPYTFDLLEASGFAGRSVPGLRMLTQAGGRLEPDRVRSWARLGRARGFDLVVMYGQTEATARMAYLPPHLAESAPGAVGVAVPGSRLRVDAEAGQDAGELVLTGPGVMLGYAETPADLGRGREVHELRTGDRARVRPDGLLEVLGRADRVVKVFGLRVDLDRVETLLGTDRVPVQAVAVGDRLVLVVTAARHEQAVRARAAELLALPAHTVRVLSVAAFPRTSAGKPDRAALVRHVVELDRLADRDGPGGVDGFGPDAVLQLYRELLGRPDAGPGDSFATLDGDSLSYVEVSIRLEDLLGDLPRDWPARTAHELGALVPGAVADDEAPAPAPRTSPPSASRSSASRSSVSGSSVSGSSASRPRPRRRWARVETATVLRALAIVLVVGSHADVFAVQGGAHLLLAVVGFNLARFQLVDVPGRSRPAALLRGAAAVALPAALWIGAVALLTGYYRPTTALLLTNVAAAGQPWTVQWQFWFLEVVVWCAVGLAALLAVPALDRLERRRPYGVALGVLLLALGLRVLLTGGLLAGPMERYSAPVLLWLVALGWLVARSVTWPARVGASVLAVLTVAGFMGEPGREAVVVGGLLLLVWLPTLPLPRVLVQLVGVLAASSMFVYLSHWQVYPPFEQAAPWLGLLLSLAVGVAVWKAWGALGAGLLRPARLRPDRLRPDRLRPDRHTQGRPVQVGG